MGCSYCRCNRLNGVGNRSASSLHRSLMLLHMFLKRPFVKAAKHTTVPLNMTFKNNDETALSLSKHGAKRSHMHWNSSATEEASWQQKWSVLMKQFMKNVSSLLLL